MVHESKASSITNVDFYLLRAGDEFIADYEALVTGIEEFWPINEALYRRLGDVCMQMLGAEENAVVVAVEYYHVDSTYRSAYYTHYSHRHFDVPRWTVRLSFFDWNDLLSVLVAKQKSIGVQNAEANVIASLHNSNWTFTIIDWVEIPTSQLQKAFLGSTVIWPTHLVHLGRTLLSPARMITYPEGVNASLALMRLSTFELNIAGKKLRIRAFPFHDQDHDLMSCAEVTILNLMKYYANEFHGYRDIEPEDILSSEQHNAYSRLVPTTGLAYPDLCAVLQEFGFQPELYEADDIGKRWQHPLPNGWAFNRLLHTYIESGIPTAINVSPIDDSFTGHSLICIGYTGIVKNVEAAANEGILLDIVEKRNDKSDEQELYKASVGCRVIHAADLHREYVVIDDNQLPYAVRDIESLSLHANMHNARLVAPLKMGMTVDADDILFIFEQLARDINQGVQRWAGRWISLASRQMGGVNEVRVVMRTFLASSKRFKTYRVATLGPTCGFDRAQAYLSTPLPHYVWVCEFLLMHEYEKLTSISAVESGARAYDEVSADELQSLPQVFGEYVMDATSGPANVGSIALVISHFPQYLGVRMPSGLGDSLAEAVLDKSTWLDGVPTSFGGFPCFLENLDAVLPSALLR